MILMVCSVCMSGGGGGGGGGGALASGRERSGNIICLFPACHARVYNGFLKCYIHSLVV